jgi:hypothetical protein
MCLLDPAPWHPPSPFAGWMVSHAGQPPVRFPWTVAWAPLRVFACVRPRPCAAQCGAIPVAGGRAQKPGHGAGGCPASFRLPAAVGLVGRTFESSVPGWNRIVHSSRVGSAGYRCWSAGADAGADRCRVWCLVALAPCERAGAGNVPRFQGGGPAAFQQDRWHHLNSCSSH